MSNNPESMRRADPASPVSLIAPDPADAGAHLDPGTALCLSGGGYRAMLFHVGTFLRLNDFGYLPKLDRVSSVSGGSITAGVLGLNWNRLTFDGNGVASNLTTLLVDPIRHLASITIDAESILSGIALPGSIAERVADEYRKYLFGHSTLQDLPDQPRFVFNATNVQSGALWRFSKPFMADYRVGVVRSPRIELAVAVGASSAFPPVLSPVEMRLESSDFDPESGLDLQREPFTTQVILTDGGVYDNLGLETAWKKFQTVLVSDAGGKMAAEEEPKRDWVRHARRILDLVDNQVRSLRKRQVIQSFIDGHRTGAYWGIRTNIRDYHLSDALDCPFDQTTVLANTPTRLKRLDSLTQDRIINWGYAVCDAAMRKHVDHNLARPSGFPYPGSAVG